MPAFEDEFDEDGTWICPECHDDGIPDQGCAVCGAIDGND